MLAIEKVEQLLSEMSLGEKAQVLQWITQDLTGTVPGIETTSAVLGGEPRIVRTRIPVWILVRYRQLGMDDAGILDAYPSLRAEDLANAWAYYRLHREEIDRQIRENEEA